MSNENNKRTSYILSPIVDDHAPFNSLEGMCQWASDLGYKGIQIPVSGDNLIDLELAYESETYCDEFKGKVNSCGLEITELSTHIEGQLVAVHQAHDLMFDVFAPEKIRGNPKARTDWAIDRMKKSAVVSRRLGTKAQATFSGSLLWPFVHPWPQQPKGLVEMGFKELAKRWKPILDTFDENGIDLGYEVHPVEDIHDGVTFERFREATGNHARANILYDPISFCTPTTGLPELHRPLS